MAKARKGGEVLTVDTTAQVLDYKNRPIKQKSVRREDSNGVVEEVPDDESDDLELRDVLIRALDYAAGERANDRESVRRAKLCALFATRDEVELSNDDCTFICTSSGKVLPALLHLRVVEVLDPKRARLSTDEEPTLTDEELAAAVNGPQPGDPGYVPPDPPPHVDEEND